MNDRAQQISRTDAYRPQGSAWDGTQNEHPGESAGLNNPLTMGLDVEPESADWRSLRDILVLLLFAVLLRLAETVEGDDVPGWWRQEAADWRMAIDTDALERRTRE